MPEVYNPYTNLLTQGDLSKSMFKEKKAIDPRHIWLTFDILGIIISRSWLLL